MDIDEDDIDEDDIDKIESARESIRNAKIKKSTNGKSPMLDYDELDMILPAVQNRPTRLDQKHLTSENLNEIECTILKHLSIRPMSISEIGNYVLKSKVLSRDYKIILNNLAKSGRIESWIDLRKRGGTPQTIWGLVGSRPAIEECKPKIKSQRSGRPKTAENQVPFWFRLRRK